jgi:hypothetical protein
MTAKRAVILVTAAASALAPVPPWLVEHLYTAHLYTALQRVLTSLSNLVPFALFDALVVALAAAWLGLAASDLARLGWRRSTARAAGRTLVWAAAVYLLFLATWGLNYRRVPLVDRLEFDPDAVTDAGVERLAATTVQRVNVLYAPGHAEGWPSPGTIDPALAGAFERTVRDLERERIVLGRPKHTIFDWYFRRAGVDGMTNPFLLETLVAGDLLPFERPFVIAHEWGHLAGLADEGEANFAGWLACMRGSPADQYSGWFFLYGEVVRAVRGGDRQAVASKLGEGPRKDLRAVRERMARHIDPRVSAAGFRVYDSYLKANRVEGGMASYGSVVKLVLGLRVARG